MIEIPSLRAETRYGIPVADQLLFNREYVIGYSYLFRQARFAMEVIDQRNREEKVERTDTFRPDLRIPIDFRAELNDFKGFPFDRGHLVSSADRRVDEVKNSETFLLTNMSPQAPRFNRGVWKKLEQEVRDLANKFAEVYVICGPLFVVGQKVSSIGKGDTKVPVPHGYFKSVLGETVRGQMKLWSFIFPNKASSKPTKDFLVSTREVELKSGLPLWDRLKGANIASMKRRKARSWPPR